ncbi:hypothetical protein RSOLAG1IB_07571 [Rhizoctonia solani AG-1 IB]|uniref:Uncharacterized protein n=1 Tax=Thanatephorus cucumeris (strain AG1-IB / isolate 7/3/14) TaxID=1108050 RepID=A0A0B7FIS0_THACB|nr:hypothetical protein RSOLAG1IB_07571 [Rhizoctonia solani AG-1 IB]
MDVPARRISVTTDIPNTTYTIWNEHACKFIPQDQWTFDSMIFYAYDARIVPPRDWNKWNFNIWTFVVHEKDRCTGEKRAIHFTPEYTIDGRVKRLSILLHPSPDPPPGRGVVKECRMDDPPQISKLKTYKLLFHFELLKIIKSQEWKETYLHGILPFDSNQFCVNFAHFFHKMELIDNAAVTQLTTMTQIQWTGSVAY